MKDDLDKKFLFAIAMSELCQVDEDLRLPFIGLFMD